MDGDERELAYLAGFFDGEGYVGVSRQSSRRGKRGTHGHVLRVSIGQLDQRPLELFYARFGGSLKQQRSQHYQRRMWSWSLTSRAAEVFLREIAPWLIVKDAEVRLALLYRDTYTGRGNHLTIGADLGAEREAYAEALRRLKHAVKTV